LISCADLSRRPGRNTRHDCCRQFHNTVAYIYKHRYSDRQASEIAMRDHSTLNEITKEGGLDGIDFNYSITTGNPQGIADDFPTAQATPRRSRAGSSRRSR
jgi:hypothetical protein